jgi:hypothetical protein
VVTAWDVDELAGEVVDAAQEHEREPLALVLQLCHDVLGAQGVLARARPQAHDLLGRVEPAVRDVAPDGVAVGRERGVLDDDAPPLAVRAVERRKHQVKVDR